MHKNGQKCLKKPENQQNGAQKNLNSGLYLKILMPARSYAQSIQSRISFASKPRAPEKRDAWIVGALLLRKALFCFV